MQGSNNKSRGEFSSLATQLQQAWLQSQIPKAAVQKRGGRLSSMVIPATAPQRRLGGPSSSSSFFCPAQPVVDQGCLSSIVPGFATSHLHQQKTTTVVVAEGVQKLPPSSSAAAFLERCDSSSGFPERPLLPMLSSYSTKTSNFPTRRAAVNDNSLEICDYDNSWIDEILSVPEKAQDRTFADDNGLLLMRDYTHGLGTAASRGGGFTSVNTHLSGNGMDSDSSEYMYEVLNATQYLEREAQAPARIGGYGQSLPQLEHGAGMIPSGAKRWFQAVDGGGFGDLPRVDLADLLLRCAKVVEQKDVRKANDLIGELRQHSSAYGNGVQRMAYYFVEALAARLSGTGGRLYAAICSNCPPPAVLLKAYCLYVDNVPYTKMNRLFSNMTILDAFEGASNVHVIDYGISHGIQWQCLIQHLATRPEGSPHLRITGIDRPQPGFNSSARVLETGHRLTEFAKMWRVPFEYHAFCEKWENISTAQLALRRDEVLAVKCFKLHYLLDESVMAESPRKIVLNRIRSLKPKVFVEGVVSAGYNAPFFMSRFRECVKHFSTMFDSVEGSLPPDDPDRVLLEQECFGKEILNIVACEGLERVERAEPYRQWQSRTQRAGFTQRPLNPTIMSKMKAMMGSYPKEFGIGEDGGWILTGWKNHIIYGLSSWEPNLVATTIP